MGEITAAAALEFVAAHPHVYLLGRRPDGWPTGWPMVAVIRDNTVEFSTYRASAKVRNLLRDGVAGLVAVDDSPGARTVLWAEGEVSLVEDGGGPVPGRASAVVPAEVPADVVALVGRRHREGKRVVLRMTVRGAHLGRAPEQEPLSRQD